MKDIFHDNFILFFWFNEKKEFKNYGGNMINKTLIPWTH